MISELSLELDIRAQKSMNELMKHYNVNNRADIISIALMVLKLISRIEKTEGELIARKGGKETKIIVN